MRSLREWGYLESETEVLLRVWKTASGAFLILNPIFHHDNSDSPREDVSWRATHLAEFAGWGDQFCNPKV